MCNVIKMMTASMVTLHSDVRCPLSVRSPRAQQVVQRRPANPGKLRTSRALKMRVRAGEDEPKRSPEVASSIEEAAAEFKAMKQPKSSKPKRQADSTDAVSSFLTRRFGIAGGLAWLGVLTFGVVTEQLKTRRENFIAERDTKEVIDAKIVTTASGVVFQDKVVGGGEKVEAGLLVGVSYSIFVDDKLVFDASKRPQILLFGGKKSAGALSKGALEALSSMRAGGKRVVTVTPEMGFGDEGLKLPGGEIPAGATIRYDLNLMQVSIPPS